MSKGVAVEFCFQKLKLLNTFKECLYYFSKLKKKKTTPQNKPNLEKQSSAMFNFPGLKGTSIWIGQ